MSEIFRSWPNQSRVRALHSYVLAKAIYLDRHMSNLIVLVAADEEEHHKAEHEEDDKDEHNQGEALGELGGGPPVAVKQHCL